MKDSLANSIKKYLDGTASPEEKKQVQEYYESFSGEANFTEPFSQQEKKALEEKILMEIYSHIRPLRITPSRQRTATFRRYVLPLAASVTALVVLTFIYSFFFSEKTVWVSTAYGEVKTHILPDQSEVILNGNSVLEYTWENEGDRSVSLQGEAYFSVRHTANHRPFIVHIPGEYQIEVLGTEFSVAARDRNSRVVLNSGKVKLKPRSPGDSTITMKPGDMVELKAQTKKVIRSTVNAERYSSWKDHKLIFDNTPLEEIVAILEETYGYRVTVRDKSLLKETFTGTIPDDDINVLLLGLRKLELAVTQNGKRIEIKK